MANEKHVALLKSDVEAWDKWREENPEECPDLIGANLNGADLRGAHLGRAKLKGADLRKAKLHWCNLYKAELDNANLSYACLYGAYLEDATLVGTNLYGADLDWADLDGADLRRADIREADLKKANLRQANLSDADLRGASLYQASLVETDLSGAKLERCNIYGIAVWDIVIDGQTSQRDLVIAPGFVFNPVITVDNLKVAQFIYLLLNNEEIRHVIDTITSKVVLILGRFTKERKQVLDKLRDELRRRDYVPVLFDFGKPESRDLTETISALAHIARFVIADITDAKAVPQELQKIVPNLPTLPVRPIILNTQYEYGMFKDFGGYLSVLPPYRYRDTDHLLETLEEQVISPALERANKIEGQRKAFEEELAKGLFGTEL